MKVPTKLTGVNYWYLYVMWPSWNIFRDNSSWAFKNDCRPGRNNKEFFIGKGIDISKIKFTGIDGTSAMSSNNVELQWRLGHFSPYSIYLNCRNHWLAQCLVYLVKQFLELLNLDKLLISIWKLFEYSCIKNSIFLEAQVAINLKPVKILKACATR